MNARERAKKLQLDLLNSNPWGHAGIIEQAFEAHEAATKRACAEAINKYLGVNSDVAEVCLQVEVK